MRDPNNLLALLAIAEQGSIDRAAVSSSVSQPARTRTIHQFEAVIGLPLLIRSSKGVRLTTLTLLSLPSHRRSKRRSRNFACPHS